MKTVFVGAKPHIKSLLRAFHLYPIILGPRAIACILEPANN